MSTGRKLHRFNLQFNANDPVQQYAFDVLMMQGRHKASFVARAIKFYVANSSDAYDAQGSPIDNAYLKNIIATVMAEIQKGQNSSVTPVQPATLPEPTPPKQSPNPQSNPVAAPVPSQSTSQSSPGDVVDIDKMQENVDFALDALDMF